MKIGEQPISDAKFITGRDEYIRLASKGHYFIILLVAGFKNTQAGRTNSDNAPTICACRIYRRCSLRIYLPPFAVHFMFKNIVNGYRQKCTGSDMKRYRYNFSTHCRNAVQEAWGKM